MCAQDILQKPQKSLQTRWGCRGGGGRLTVVPVNVIPALPLSLKTVSNLVCLKLNNDIIFINNFQLTEFHIGNTYTVELKESSLLHKV